MVSVLLNSEESTTALFTAQRLGFAPRQRLEGRVELSVKGEELAKTG
ncbi:hypothetical protein [Synechococcus sp. MIT S1220]